MYRYPIAAMNRNPSKWLFSILGAVLLCCATALSLMEKRTADTPSSQDPTEASLPAAASGVESSALSGQVVNGNTAMQDLLSLWPERGTLVSAGGHAGAHAAGSGASHGVGGLSAASAKPGAHAANKTGQDARDQNHQDQNLGANQEQEAQPEEEPPEVYETVTGRVLDENRVALAGIAVGIQSLRLFGSGKATAQRGPVAVQVVSDGNGYFVAEDLLDGEYALQTKAGEPYIEARKVVRAGMGTVELILKNGQKTSVFGYVLDEVNDKPLAGARVSALGQTAVTGQDGRFELTYAAHPSTSPMLRFDAEDYRTHYASATASDPEEPLIVYLTPETLPVHIQGQLLTTSGKPVVDEVVQLQSPILSKQYVARSDAGGWFTFAAVESGLDYQLSVTPKGPYHEYLDAQFRVSPDLEGRMLSILLKPVPFAELDGYVLDADGQAISHYTFELVSDDVSGWRRLVQTDANGYFTLDQVPAGQVLFRGNTGSEFLASGLVLAPGAVERVQIHLDWGGYEIYGQVLDANGAPAAGSHLQLIWSASQGQLLTQSSRNATTDAQGYFLFDRLGPGAHTLQVSKPGAPHQRVVHQTGSDNPKLVVWMM